MTDQDPLCNGGNLYGSLCIGSLWKIPNSGSRGYFLLLRFCGPILPDKGALLCLKMRQVDQPHVIFCQHEWESCPFLNKHGRVLNVVGSQNGGGPEDLKIEGG